MTDETVQPLRAKWVPLPVQTQHYLLSLIDNGTYHPGAQLPSENELAAQLGISRPTLREALHNLEQEGVIVRKHGIGTFVAPGYGPRLDSGLEGLVSILELATRQGMQPRCQALQVQQETARPDTAERLRIEPDTLLTIVQRAINVEGTKVAYLMDVVPSSILSPSDIDETFDGSVLDLLRRKPGLHIAHAVANIVALNADGFLSDRLAVEPGQAVLLLEETLFDDQDSTLDYSRNYFIPDFFRFYVVRR